MFSVKLLQKPGILVAAYRSTLLKCTATHGWGRSFASSSKDHGNHTNEHGKHEAEEADHGKQENEDVSSRRYTKDHEWLEVKKGEEKIVRVGISDYAQNSLGDVVFVELPAVGTEVSFQDPLGAVESVKAASDIYAPCSGTVIAVNELLATKPGMMNKHPFGKGWLCDIEMSDVSEADQLMNHEQYTAFCQDGGANEGEE